MNHAPITTTDQPISHLADEILTKRQLATRIQKSNRTVDAWMKAKRLPYLKIGKAVLFRWGDVLDKLSAFRVN